MKYFFINLIIISILLYLFGFSSDLLYIGGDYNGYLSSKQIFDNLSVWNNNTFVFYNLSLILKYSIFYIYTDILHIPNGIANFMGFLSIIMLGLYSFKYYINFILKKINKEGLDEKLLFLLSYFYIFSLYFTIRFIDGHIDFIVFYYSLPIIFYFLSRFIDTNKIDYGIYAVLSMIFISNIFISIYLVFFSFIIFISYYIFYSIFISSNKINIYVKIKNIILLSVIFVLLSLPFIMSYYFYSSSLDMAILGTDPINFLKSISLKNTFTDFLIGNGYWALNDGFDGYYYYTFHELITNKVIVIVKIIILITIITLLLLKDKKRNYFLLFISLFLLTIFLETFFFLLIKFERFDILTIFINKLPFLREPVAKIEGLYYLSLSVLLSLFLLQFYKSKFRGIIISILLITVLGNIYIYTVSFKNRYSTNFIDNGYINQQKDINLSNSDRFIVIPSIGDYICINNNTGYCGPNILKGVSMGEYYVSPGGAPILIDTPHIDNIIETIKGKGINKIVIQKDYNYIISNKETRYIYLELISKLKQKYKTIYNDKSVSVIDLGDRKYFNTSKSIGISEIKILSKYSYKVKINLTGTGKIIFNDTYNKYWEILDQNNQKIDFKHIKTSFYTNSWVISKSDIINHVKQNYSQVLKKGGYPIILPNGKKDYKYFILNNDGSLDLLITIYFKPQRYFYNGLIISGTTILLIFGYLWYTNKYRHRKHKKIKKTV